MIAKKPHVLEHGKKLRNFFDEKITSKFFSKFAVEIQNNVWINLSACKK